MELTTTNSHFDSDDLIPPTQQKTDFRLPQPQATLPRVLDPMPFPKTLFETLTHGAAFIEQAGYLTIQAQNVRSSPFNMNFLSLTVVRNSPLFTKSFTSRAPTSRP